MQVDRHPLASESKRVMQYWRQLVLSDSFSYVFRFYGQGQLTVYMRRQVDRHPVASGLTSMQVDRHPCRWIDIHAGGSTSMQVDRHPCRWIAIG
jgi:hypothetical protein